MVMFLETCAASSEGVHCFFNSVGRMRLTHVHVGTMEIVLAKASKLGDKSFLFVGVTLNLLSTQVYPPVLVRNSHTISKSRFCPVTI